VSSSPSSNYISIYIVVAAIIGLVVGALFGAIFDGAIPGRRTIAVLSALAAIVVDYFVRRYASGVLPNLFLGAKAAKVPPSLLFVAFIIALAGGLATHDLALLWNVSNGAVLGGFAGLFAALMTAILVVIREQELAHTVKA
jgi:hypothetical protein